MTVFDIWSFSRCGLLLPILMNFEGDELGRTYITVGGGGLGILNVDKNKEINQGGMAHNPRAGGKQ